MCVYVSVSMWSATSTFTHAPGGRGGGHGGEKGGMEGGGMKGKREGGEKKRSFVIFFEACVQGEGKRREREREARGGGEGRRSCHLFEHVTPFPSPPPSPYSLTQQK